MRRRFHLVALTTDLTRVLAMQTPAGWLLPMLQDDGRSELPDQVEGLLKQFVSGADMVHETATVADLRNASLDCYQGVCVAVISGDAAEAAPGVVPAASAAVVPIATDELLARPAVLPAQREALASAVARQRAPVGRFDSASQVADALAWAGREVARVEGATVDAIDRHRCARHEYVVRLHKAAGQPAERSGAGGDASADDAGRKATLYFKGGRERVDDEALLTVLLWGMRPSQFPRTVAVDPQHDRWIYRELEGELLVGDRLTLTRAVAAVRSLASLQRQVTREGAAVREHLARRSMNAVEMFARVDAIVCHASATAGAGTTAGADATAGAGVTTDADAAAGAGALSRWPAESGSVRQACEDIDSLGLPRSLVLSDFWGRNIVLTELGDGSEGIGFIDLEHSYWSYPFLSLGRFLGEVTRRLPEVAEARATLEQAFIEEWTAMVPAEVMARGVNGLPFLGRLFGVLLESRECDLLERSLDAELPPGYRAARLAGPIDAVLGATPGAG
jgi:hypothetical protein